MCIHPYMRIVCIDFTPGSC
uniref:Uncharacterized protein n=1 Tax=Caldiarchaeum subterraneum TaxID=311458 RepID=A0A7C4I725_CALS0